MEKFLEYKKSFLFGIKFVLLFIALFLPISLFSFLGYGLYYGFSKAPLLSNRELSIEHILYLKTQRKLMKKLWKKLNQTRIW